MVYGHGLGGSQCQLIGCCLWPNAGDAAGTEVGAAAAASRCLETLMRGAKVPTPHAKDSASSAHTARNMVNLNL